ncbi:ATP-binding protein [Rhodospira trueperi]|uniref:histidine kinase n=1 Tax=Rhodospira trueperi TaxID=69960 RepID=A0A1G7AC33_9PROT|nr:ATP-binding protein [Rhodospira trueperi]SDE12027.1 Signal transduction histidine kinase [Rhodospira trueperi]
MSVRILRAVSLALVVVAMMIVGYLAWAITATYEHEYVLARHSLARTLTHRIDSVIERTLFMADAVAAMLLASDHVTEAEFAAFVESVNLFGPPEAVRAVGLSVLVDSEQWPALARSLTERQAERAALGYPPLVLAAPPGPAAGAYAAPMLYAESPEGRAGIIGFDMASNAERLETLLASRDAGEARVTAPVRLSQDPRGAPPSILIMKVLAQQIPLAVNTGDAPGVIAVSLTPGRLIGAVLGDGTAAAASQPRVRVEDVTGDAVSRDLYHSPGLGPDSEAFDAVHLPILNRTWRVSFYPPLAGGDGHRTWLVNGLTGVALLVLVALGLVLDSNLRFRVTLQQRVDERTTELTRVNADLRDTARRAEAANVAKSEFLANMSHELRTPLNAIIGFSELMANRVLGPLPETYAEYPDLIGGSGRHLLEIVDNVLDLSLIEAESMKLERERFGMSALVNEVLALLSRTARDKGVSLENGTDALHALFLDRKRIRQTLFNVIGNAVKFTPPGGRVVVRNRCGDGSHRLIIEDTGRGMSAAQIAVALRPFGQVHGDPMTRQHGGAGLGLSLSAEIMRLHGGRLEIHSRPEEGTCVILAFPADADNPAHD